MAFPEHLPPALLTSLRPLPGFDETAFRAVHAAAQPPVSVRLNSAKPSAVFPDAEPVPWCATGRYLPQRPVFTLDPLFHAGCYYVQEASSMFLEHALKSSTDLADDLRVLDLCAAPGGKSTLLAGLLSPDSLLVANEVIKPRAGILADNLTRWGALNAFVTNNDPRDFGRLSGFFDLLVVDAPCSGSGLFRKDPGAVAEWSPEAVTLCAQRQRRILSDAWACLREGGLLVYSTCSYSQAENEDQLDWLAETFAVESLRMPLKPQFGGIVETTSDRAGAFGYRFYPDRVRGEGFFLAVFRKISSEKEARFRLEKPRPSKTARTERDAFRPWLNDVDAHAWTQRGEDFFLLNPEHRADFEALAQTLYLRKAGVRLGRLAGRELLPDHELALSTALNADSPSLDLDRENALRFLKKEPFEYQAETTGWAAVRYEGHALGWAKVLPNRLNNYLPKDWRILMDIPEN